MSILHFLAWSSKTSSDEFRDFHSRSHIDLCATNTEGLSSLHLAAQRGNVAIIQYIAHTTNALREMVNLKDSKGRTALHYAVENKRGALAGSILLSYGADVGARDQDGRSPLHHAAKLGRLPAVECLVAALNAELADQVYAVDVWGMTPETVAMLYARDDVAMFLRGNMARLLEMGTRTMGKHVVSELRTRSCGALDGKVCVDLASSERREIGSWLRRGWTRWPVVEISGYLRQVNIRCLQVIWIMASMIVIWRVGAVSLSIR